MSLSDGQRKPTLHRVQSTECFLELSSSVGPPLPRAPEIDLYRREGSGTLQSYHCRTGFLLRVFLRLTRVLIMYRLASCTYNGMVSQHVGIHSRRYSGLTYDDYLEAKRSRPRFRRSPNVRRQFSVELELLIENLWLTGWLLDSR